MSDERFRYTEEPRNEIGAVTRSLLERGVPGIADLLVQSKPLRGLQALDDDDYVASGVVLANWPDRESDRAAYESALKLVMAASVYSAPGLQPTADEISYLHDVIEPFSSDMLRLASRPTPSELYEIATRVVPLADQQVCFRVFNYGQRQGLSRVLQCLPASLESALSYVLTLFLDGSLPYRENLCRCKLPSCSRLYIVDSNVPHRRNTSFCCAEHRDQRYRETAKDRQRKARRKRLKN